MTTKYLLCLGFVHIFDDVDDMWIGFPEAQYIRYSGRRTHAVKQNQVTAVFCF